MAADPRQAAKDGALLGAPLSPPASPEKPEHGVGQLSQPAAVAVAVPDVARQLFTASDVPTERSSLKEIKAFVRANSSLKYVELFVGGRQRRTKAHIVADILATLDGTPQPTVPTPPVEIDTETGFEVGKIEHEHDDVEALVVVYVERSADKVVEVWIDTRTVIDVLGYSKSYDPFENQRKSNPSVVKGRTIRSRRCLNRKEFMTCVNKFRRAVALSALCNTLSYYFEETPGVTFQLVGHNEEDHWISKIKQATHRFQSHREDGVLGRRIDLYFPIERLAVECDEHGHAAYPAEAESAREADIAAELDCRFYRFNPHCRNPTHTVEYHIGEILHLLYNANVVQTEQC